MNKKLVIIFSIIALTSVLVCVLTCVLTGGCCSKEQPKSYYMYDYYYDDFLVTKNAVIVEQTELNDSVSLLDITNHLSKRKGRECALTYTAIIYQKKNEQGISYSEDGANYELCYSNDSLPIQFRSQVFGFFQLTEANRIQLIDNISFLGNHYKVYLEYGFYNSAIFCEGIDLPIFGKWNSWRRYYQLSKVINKKKNLNLDFIEKVKYEAPIFGGIGHLDEFPIGECYIEFLKEALDMKEKGLSDEYIFRETGISKEEILLYKKGIISREIF